MLWWLWNLLRPRWAPMFPAKPLRWGGRVPKKPQAYWEMKVFERPNGSKELGWRWPADNVMAGLSEPYDYFGKPPHQGSRKIT